MHDVSVFIFPLTSKLPLMALMWLLALLVSFGLRFWGVHHPEPFHVRPLLVFGLLLGPSLLLGCWILLSGFQTDS